MICCIQDTTNRKRSPTDLSWGVSHYKITSLTDENRGELYFDNERVYRYYHILLKEFHEEADKILVLMSNVLESWLVDHVAYNISEIFKLHMLSKIYELLVNIIGIDKNEVLSLIAENASLKYDPKIQNFDDIPEGKDENDY